MSLRPDNVLIHRLGSLGDTLVCFPALHWIRQQFPNARITMLTNCPANGKASPASAILNSTGLADDYLAYPLATRSLAALARLHRQIARRHFDIAFALAEARGRTKSIRDWLFFRSCGIRRVIGSPLRRRDLVYLPSGVGQLYEPEALRLIRRIGANAQINLEDDRWWDLHLSAKERAGASRLLEEHCAAAGFIALGLGTQMEVKDWTLPNWRRLVSELARKYSHLPLIGFGVREEHQNTDDVLRLWPGVRANFCGLLSVRMSATLLERATVFVGHDSGPMHLAAAVGTKCVAIFSARILPGVWFPRGHGHKILYHRTECTNCGLSICRHHAKKCILGISVEEVLAAIGQILDRDAPVKPKRHAAHRDFKSGFLSIPETR